MNKARIQDLEIRHRLGRQELDRLLALTGGNVAIKEIYRQLGNDEAEQHLARLKVVVDDIRATRVQLIPAWLTEHYPDEAENFKVTPGKPQHQHDFPMGFDVCHMQHAGRPALDMENLRKGMIAYLSSIGGFTV